MSKLTLCYSPRSSLSLNIQQQTQLIQKICLSLDKIILDNLKFHMKTKALNQEQFLQLMLKNLSNFQTQLSNREIKLNKSLLEMFHQITIGKEELVYWSDLSDYFINKARESKVDDVKYNEQIYSKSQDQIKVRCQNKIQKCVYVKTLSLVLYIEQNTNIIEVLNSQTLVSLGRPIVYQPQKLTVQSSTVRRNQGKTIIATKQFIVQTNIKIIDFIYISSGRYNILMCSLSNGLVNARTFNNGVFVPASHPDNDTELLEYKFDKIVYCMEWDANNQTLYCGCQNDTIYKWSFKTSSVSTFQCSNQDHLVTSLANIPKLQMMASGSMDGKLILWDTVTNAKKSVYKQHHRGILTMVFSQSTMLLFTAGFDHSICIWNPYVQGVINKISTHLQTITQMSTYKDKLIALDQKGSIQMYNIKTFTPLHQLVLDNNQNHLTTTPSYFCILDNPHRLLICSHRINLFTYQQINTNKYAENNYTSHVHYMSNLLSLFTVTGDKINKWSMLTGELDKAIKIGNGVEVSAIEFDGLRQLIYIAIKTRITVYNSKNLLKIRQFPSQPNEVNIIKTFRHFKKDRCIAVVEGFHNIHIYKQTIGNKYQLMKQLNVYKDVVITFFDYNEIQSNLIVGNNAGIVGVYDIETGKSINNSRSIQEGAQILNIYTSILNKSKILVEVTKSGMISLLDLSSNLNRIISCQMKDSENIGQNQRINCSDFDAKTLRLFTGDEKGYITCYGIRIGYDVLNNQTQKMEFYAYLSTLNQPNKNNQDKLRSTSTDYTNSQFQKLWVFKTHQEGVISLQFIEDSEYIVSSGHDRKIRIRKDNGQYLNQFKVTKEQLSIDPIFYIESNNLGGDAVGYSDYLTKKKLDVKKSIEFKQESIFDPRYFIDRVETGQLPSLHSNPNWKVFVNYAKYCQNQKLIYKNYISQTKSTRQSVQKKQALPKLRQNLEKNINDSLKYIFNSQEGKNNIAIQTSFMYQPKLSKVESLPRISQSLKAKRASRDNLNSLSKPKLKGVSYFAADNKPKVEALSKQVVDAYNKLSSIIEHSFDKNVKFTQVNKRKTNKQQK